MKFYYSIQNKKEEAVATKNSKIKFFLPNIKRFDPDKEFEKFIAYLVAVEFHELGHTFNSADGCNDHDKDTCSWCEETEKYFST